jgi:MOSC domain
VRHLPIEELEAALDHILQSPKDVGLVQLIVGRPQIDEREVLTEAEFSVAEGLIGDNWSTRGSNKTVDGSPHPDRQINIMNSRVAAVVAQEKERWSLAGDQLFVDMDLSRQNLPPGSRIALGTTVIEVTPPAHTGCKKFVERFGMDAMQFVNSDLGKELCLRGVNAKVVESGVVRVGDVVRKL